MTARVEVVAGRRVALFPWHEVNGEYQLLSCFWIAEDDRLMVWCVTTREWDTLRERSAIFTAGREALRGDARRCGTDLAAIREQLTKEVGDG